jgi:Skp family chaperone for outer membrane proteins
MKTMFMAAAAALCATASVAAAPAAHAQAAPGIGVVDIAAVVEQSAAYQAASQQIRTTYAAQYTQAQQRQQQIAAELKPQYEAFEAAQQQPNADRQQLAGQYQAIRQREAEAQRELGTIIAPAARADAYVQEQIAKQLPGAIDRVMTRRGLAIILRPESTLGYLPSVDITADVITELNTAVPTVSITPPADWQPGQAGQQQQQAPAQPQQNQGR